jgi:phosphohistidine phosphatase
MLRRMLLTLVRHGDADASNTSLGDAGRCLSARGREQARATGRALALQDVRLTHVWSSPLVVQMREDLYPDSSPRSLLEAVRSLDAGADVLVVGHMPYMAALAGELLGTYVGFTTGAALRVEIAAASQRATLIWKTP